jgi:thiol-disulfide isomerase/thioredoxin
MRLSLPFLVFWLCCVGSRGVAQAPPVAVLDSFSQLQNRLAGVQSPVVVINFWATWCAPCVAELPHFEQLNQQYANRGVKVILVSLDIPSQVQQRLVPFLQKHKLMSEVVVMGDQDADTWIPQVCQDWDGALPATFVIKGGKTTAHLSDFKNYNELEAFVGPFVDTGAQPTASRR